MYFQQAKWWNVKAKRVRMTALRMCIWAGFMGTASLIGLDASGPASPSHETRVPIAIKDNLQSSSNDKPAAALQDTAVTRPPIAIKDDLQSSGDGEKLAAAAQDTAESRAPVAVKDDLQSSGDGEKLPAAAQDTAESRVPVAVKDDLQSGGNGDKPLAAAQDNVASPPMSSAKSVGSRAAACCFRTPSARTAKAKPSHIARSAICPADCEAKAPFIVRSSERMPSTPDRTLSASEPKGTSLGLSAFRGGRAILGQAVDASGAVLMGGKRALDSVIGVVW
jgi:hypothetical protein